MIGLRNQKPSFFNLLALPALLLIIFACAWLMQSNILFNVDVAWLSEASRRMLAGGTYSKDFFENNPPWILYFYTPAVLLTKLGISIISSTRIYLFVLIAISLAFSNYFLKRIFTKQDTLQAKLFLISMALLCLLFPIYDFGQREHLLFILSMPYLLMLTLRLHHQKINPCLAMTVGFLAASVFILKPYFFIPFLLVESYYLYRQRNVLAWLRPESIIIFLLTLCYLGLVFLYHADYLNIVIPHVIHWVYLGAREPWLLLVNNLWFYWFVLVVFFYFSTYSINQYREFTTLLLLAALGLLIAYFWQGTDFDYRVLPAALMENLCFILIFNQFVTAKNKNYREYIATGLFLSCFFILLDQYPDFISGEIIRYPMVFFSSTFILCGIIFALMQHNNNYAKIAYYKAVGIALLLSGVFFYLVSFSLNWSINHVAGTLLLIIVLFALFSPGHFKENLRDSFTILVAILIFLIPIYDTYDRYNNGIKLRNDNKDFIHYLQTHAANKSVYFFTDELINPSLVISANNNIIYASRLSGFWYLPGLLKFHYFSHDKALQKQWENDSQFFINLVTEDLILKKPDFLFFDARNKKTSLFLWNNSYLTDNKLFYLNFDYLTYFKTDKSFAQLLNEYQYVDTIQGNFHATINPLFYKLKLIYSGSPHDIDLAHNIAYLYLNADNEIAIALIDSNKEIQRINITSNKNALSSQQLFTIRQAIVSKTELSQQSKQAIRNWLAQQELSLSLYKYLVYKKI